MDHGPQGKADGASGVTRKWIALVIPNWASPDEDPEVFEIEAETKEQAEVDADYNAGEGTVAWLHEGDDIEAAMAAYGDSRKSKEETMAESDEGAMTVELEFRISLKRALSREEQKVAAARLESAIRNEVFGRGSLGEAIDIDTWTVRFTWN